VESTLNPTINLETVISRGQIDYFMTLHYLQNLFSFECVCVQIVVNGEMKGRSHRGTEENHVNFQMYHPAKDSNQTAPGLACCLISLCFTEMWS